MMKRLMMCGGLLLSLAACGGGGGGGGGSGIDPRLARLDVYEAQKLRVLGDPGAGVMGMPVTTAEDVPVGGAMTFAGSGTMRVETGAEPVVIFGDARLSVDFDNGDAAGAIENTFGTNANGDVMDYNGTIALQSDGPGQNMALDYQGTLNSSGRALTFDGTMRGVFLGNPVRALTAGDLEAGIDDNGVMRSGTLIVTMEVEETQNP
ncbi:hypothetical protein QTO30_06780 [Yoonia sp. GPGPB17]|uniref:hypothetical protein n=1 Tax=Yoonia sp. GPGPB17 TaxID=3026147 RepID=UPI0030C1DCC2